MKLKWKDLLYGLILLVLFTGVFVWMVFSRPLNTLSIIIGVTIILIGFITITLKLRSRQMEINSGIPAEDEYIKLAKVYAGNQSFHYSIYLWMLIFMFNDTFSKNETMLGIGILGSTLIYAITLWYIKSTGEFHEQPHQGT